MSAAEPEDPYAPIAFAYDLWTRTVVADAPWYVALLNRHFGNHAAVVEVGAGAGRITAELASAGQQVLAIEPSGRMVERLEDRLAAAIAAGVVDVVRDTVVDVSIAAGSRQAVIAPFRTLAHMEAITPTWLEQAAHWLGDGGILAFDCAHLPAGLVHDTGWVMREQGYVLNDVGERVLVAINERLRRIDDEHAELAVRVSGDHIDAQTTMELWLPPPARIHALLRSAGYTVIEAHGGFHDEPLLPDSGDSLWVARPR